MDWLTTVEMSKRWNVPSRKIGVLCIEDVVKKSEMWLVPNNTQNLLMQDLRRKRLYDKCN